MANRKRGRPTRHSQALAKEICVRIAEGESLNAICADEHIPPKSTVLEWVVDDREGFADQYARAREASGHGEGDEMVEVARATLRGEYEPAAARAAIQALQWSASRKAPKSYGDKQEVTHGVTDGLSELMREIDGKSRGVPRVTGDNGAEDG